MTYKTDNAAAGHGAPRHEKEGEDNSDYNAKRHEKQGFFNNDAAHSCLDAALEYAAMGWFVLPLNPGEKKPHVKYKDRRQRRPGEKEIKKWWGQFPGAQVGIVTGPESGVDTLDVDSPEAMESLRAVATVPDTLRYKTGREGGGIQLMFKHRPGLKTMARVVPDVDIRTKGGITVLPPSTHKSGRKYQWIDVDPLEDGLAELHEWPDDLYSYLVENGAGVDSKKSEKADKSKMAGLDGVPEGERDQAIFKKACSLRSKGVEYTEAKIIILEIARNCQPPFPDGQAVKCLDSAYGYDCQTRDDFLTKIAEMDGENDFEFLTGPLTDDINGSSLPKHAKYFLLKKISKKCGIRVKYLLPSDTDQDGKVEKSQIQMAHEIIEDIGADNIIFALESSWVWREIGVWCRMDDREVKQLCQAKLQDLKADVTQNIVNSMADLFKTETFLPGHHFDQNTDAINILNGELYYIKDGA